MISLYLEFVGFFFSQSLRDLEVVEEASHRKRHLKCICKCQTIGPFTDKKNSTTSFEWCDLSKDSSGIQVIGSLKASHSAAMSSCATFSNQFIKGLGDNELFKSTIN